MNISLDVITMFFALSYVISFFIMLGLYIRQRELNKYLKKYLILFGIAMLGSIFIYVGSVQFESEMKYYSYFILGSNLLIASRVVYFTSMFTNVLNIKSKIPVQYISPLLLVVPITLYLIDQSLPKLMLYHGLILLVIHSTVVYVTMWKRTDKKTNLYVIMNIMIVCIYVFRVVTLLILGVDTEDSLSHVVNTVFGVGLTSLVPFLILASVYNVSSIELSKE